MTTLDAGIAKYPESATLRVARRTTQDTIADRLIQQAGKELNAGKRTAAQATLKRLLEIEPQNDHALALLQSVKRDEQTAAALETAKQKAGSGTPEAALTAIEGALRGDPKNRHLLEAQAALEQQSRQRDLPQAKGGTSKQPINLDFRDASVRMIFEAMARSTGINFILDKDVRPDLKTTVFIRQAKLEDALDLILSTTQLNKKMMNGSTILIYPNTPEKQRDYQDLVVRAFYLTNADAKQTGTMLKTMLKIREPYIDERANMVVIRESPDVVRLAERLVELQDRNDSEVVLEVEVLEVSSTKLTQLGIQYPNSFTLTPLSATGATSLTLSDFKGLNSDRIGVSTPSAVLNLRRELGDTDLLANPKIRAKNHEKAKILIGDKLPVITTTSTSTGFVSESVQYIDVGLKLEVEPSISPDDEVSMKINLEVSSLTNQITTRSGTVAYQIGTRSANTVLKLHDGETQLLAGLIKTQQTSSAARIPGLGDIPLLGRLFSSQTDNGVRNEIVLSITPRVVKPSHRPDTSFMEFWSGTETNARARRTLPDGQASANGKTGDSTPAAGAAPAATDQPAAANEQPTATASDDGGSIALTMSGPSAAKAGEAFWISLNLRTDTALRSMPIQLAYDKERFAFDGIEAGSLFSGQKAAPNLAKTDLPAVGRVMVTLSAADNAPLTGQGEWAKLRFRAKAAGTGAISVATATPVGLTTAPQPPQMPAPVSISVK
ncbi:secretin and TonB N-terminal domain-containing protein [Ralstonia pseudosolanacearum]|uniref:secretin and TonB N-terminal domain-containing protein n=1 Tax=Ralstonia pseudosolanacearum TaxID=1310165 RepID=UPI0020C76638|nr:type IV pilus secretin PilQ [Ralstonia pseudosolanacearum]